MLRKALLLSALAVSACNSSLSPDAQKEQAIKSGHAAFQNGADAQPAAANVPVNYFVAPPNHGAAPAAHAPAGDGKSPMAVLQELVEGNQRYIAEKSAHPSQTAARRKELASGQAPGAIIVSCSDSRVPPELVFDKGLGEVFVIRTAGEIVDSAALASVEYAVEHLHSKLVVVMGHSSCGAVKAALTTPEGKSAGSPSLDSLVASIRPAVRDFKLAPDDKTFVAPVKSNVSSVARSLAGRSPIVEHALKERKIMIVEAVYHLESGKVDFWF